MKLYKKGRKNLIFSHFVTQVPYQFNRQVFTNYLLYILYNKKLACNKSMYNELEYIEPEKEIYCNFRIMI